MSLHLRREMELLNRNALRLCAHVERNVLNATRAFLERDIELGRKVILADQEIDKMEVELAENCLKTLALYQPVAGDLRLVLSFAKFSGMLERIGDLAVKLARKGQALAQMDSIVLPPELAKMATEARCMLQGSIDSLVNSDTTTAKAVIDADIEVNVRKQLVKQQAEKIIMAHPALCPQWLLVISAANILERMADLSTNIAAEVVYSVEGRMVRHGLDLDCG